LIKLHVVCHQVIFRTFLRYLHLVLHVLHKNYENRQYNIFIDVCCVNVVSFVKFQVKLINFDGVSKSLAIILNF